MNIAVSVMVMTVLASAGEVHGADRPETGNAPVSVSAAIAATPVAGCPTREAVAAALFPAVSHLRPGRDPLPPDFRVLDLGEAFEITAGGQVQRYADAPRDCLERARVAAVFVALAVNPPSIQSPPPPPGPAAQVASTPVRARNWLSVGVAARIDDALGGGSATAGGTTAGGELEVAVGRGAFGLAATAGVVTSTESTIDAVRVGQHRFPCSLSATVRRRATTRVELRGHLGASLTPFTLHGQGLETTHPVTRFDAGARAAVELRLLMRALVPFVSLHAEYFPRTYEISVAPLGDIGATAPFQIGLSLGAAFDAPRR
jgi:hypothetical protein